MQWGYCTCTCRQNIQPLWTASKGVWRTFAEEHPEGLQENWNKWDCERCKKTAGDCPEIKHTW